MGILGTLEAIGTGFKLAEKIIDWLDTPEKRAKARRMYRQTLEELREKIKGSKDEKEIDYLILTLISHIESE
ncbi:MAG: hypothetical protein ABIL39_10695 [candidate division WOR-3 bacterium]